MKQEKSCGAVIFRQEEDGRRYLLIRSVKGHTTLCKGHVEPGESEYETAAREIGEETSLTVEFVDHFRHVITYSPYPGCSKDVVFFLARAAGGSLVCQPEEVAEAGFFPLEEALSLLTHGGDRDVLRAADEFLGREGHVRSTL